MNPKRILIVEDEHALAAALAMVCQRAGAEPVLAPSGEMATKRLQESGEFRLIILDIGLPDMSGLDWLQRTFGDESPLPVPVVMITAHGNLENAIAAQKQGVTEYLLKPLDLHEFQAVLERLLKPELRDEEEPKPVVESETTLVGAAPAMQEVFRDIAHACATSAPVVISGATGVGKSLAARLIHANSGSRDGALRVIECGTVERLPAVENGGVFVFEKIEELNAGLQAELLQLIESAPAGLRVIATTRKSLRDAVQLGIFRDDLYYRLHVLEIRLPELRRRSEDIPALAAYFLGRAETARALVLSPEFIAALRNYEWPGNVLELRNAVEYAVAICSGSRLLPQHLPASVTLARPRGNEDLDIESSRLVRSLREWLDTRLASDEITYADILTEVEEYLLRDLLARYDDRPTRLAQALKMNRTTLRRKCENITDQPI